MLSCIRRCINCQPCGILPEYDKEDERFLLKHSILTKGSYVVVVFFIEDTTGGKKCKQYTNDHYNQVENVPHTVTLAKESDFISSIVSEDGNAKIAPSNLVRVSYKALKQACRIHKVRIKSAKEGRHFLQLRIKRGDNIEDNYPFHIDLTSDDLYIYRDFHSLEPTRDQHHYESINEMFPESNLQQLLKSEKHEHIWPMLLKGGITTVSRLVEIEEKSLESISLKSNDDRRFILRLKQNLSSSRVNGAFVSEDSPYTTLQRPSSCPSSSSKFKATGTDKTNKILQMKTKDFNNIGINTLQGERIMNEARNDLKNTSSDLHESAKRSQAYKTEKHL